MVIDDPYDVRKQAALRTRLKAYTVNFKIAEPESIQKAIEIFYSFYTQPLDEVLEAEIKKFTTGGGDVVKTVNTILDLAIYLILQIFT